MNCRLLELTELETQLTQGLSRIAQRFKIII